MYAELAHGAQARQALETLRSSAVWLVLEGASLSTRRCEAESDGAIDPWAIN